MKFRHLALFALLAPLVLSPATATQPDTSTPAPLDQVKRPAGALLVPEHFMRQWDPVTVFFDGEAGPAKGGPEDHPERLVQMSPSHPGAFTWLDSHTLQFRPAIAWPPMGRFTWTVQGHKAELVTLMSAPQSSVPANGATGLDPVETISLRFAEPIAAADLARLVTIELRPLPGVGGEQSRWLDSHDFDVMAQERQAPNAPAGYVLTLHAPVPWGTKAIVHVRLSPDPAKGAEEQTLSFSTAEPFHTVSFGCRDKGFPALPEGAVYGPERALTCPADERVVQVTFSDRLSPVGPIEARNLLRFSPQVEGLSFKTVENTLVASGRFQSDTLYQLRLEPAKLKDNRGRPLLLNNASQLSLSFPARPGFVEWQKGDGIAERYGPQMLPVKARAVERVDLRIFAVDPLARSLWPFPDKGVRIDETQRPPAPGEETKRNDAPREPDASDVAGYIRSFGSPIVSELVDLPAGKSDATASFGIDVRQLLAHAVGAGKPGHYLIGIRRLDGKPERQWMRLQITDLSLTAVDEKDHVRFAVTSLASGQPVAGAKVTIEAKERGSTVEIGAGVTGADGMIDWTVPPKPDSFRTLSRVIVRKDDDLLVLDPHDHAPREYAEGGWRSRTGRKPAPRMTTNITTAPVGSIGCCAIHKIAARRPRISAISSPSARFIAPTTPCISRAMCAAISMAAWNWANRKARWWSKGRTAPNGAGRWKSTNMAASITSSTTRRSLPASTRLMSNSRSRPGKRTTRRKRITAPTHPATMPQPKMPASPIAISSASRRKPIAYPSSRCSCKRR